MFKETIGETKVAKCDRKARSDRRDAPPLATRYVDQERSLIRFSSFRGAGMLCLMAVLIGALAHPQIVGAEEEAEIEAGFRNAAIIEFDGAIDGRMLFYFERKLAAAKRAKADLVILEIRSPGGGLDESLLIAEALRDVDWATTVSYIPEKAISGAALISLGCDQIIMAPEARIGDAGVIFLDETFMFRYAPEKYMSDVVQRARSLAKTNGYPQDLAEAMVDRSAVVYRQNGPDGEPRFRIEYSKDEQVNVEATIDEEEEGGGIWDLVEGTEPNRFLVLGGEQATEIGLAQHNVSSREELAATLEVEGEFTVYEYTSVDNAVYWLNRPLLTGLLFLIGLIAIYVELSAPGISVGGLIAMLCFGLFFWSRFLGGTAVLLELLLFVLGIVFLLMEVFVIPGTGLSGILGVLLVLGSLVMASQSFVVPTTGAEVGSLAGSVSVVIGSGFAFAVFVGLATRYAGHLPLLNRFVLTPPKEAAAEPDVPSIAKAGGKSLAGIEVGAIGVADSVLRPAGKARFGQVMADVTANGDFVEVGQAVKIIEISGNRIIVRALSD